MLQTETHIIVLHIDDENQAVGNALSMAYFLRNTLASQKNFAASGLLRASIAQALFFRPEAFRKRSDPADGNPPLSPLCLNISVA